MHVYAVQLMKKKHFGKRSKKTSLYNTESEEELEEISVVY